MESFFGFILSDSMIFNSFFNYTFICKKLVSELRRFGTTGVVIKAEIEKIFPFSFLFIVFLFFLFCYIFLFLLSLSLIIHIIPFVHTVSAFGLHYLHFYFLLVSLNVSPFTTSDAVSYTHLTLPTNREV